MGKRIHNVAKTSLQGPFEAEVGGLPQFRLLVRGRAFIRERATSVTLERPGSLACTLGITVKLGYGWEGYP